MSDAEETRFPAANPRWELDPIFDGGPESEAFDAYLSELDDHLEQLRERAEARPALGELSAEATGELDRWAAFLEEKEAVGSALSEARAFARTHAAADTTDPAARALPQRVGELSSRMDRIESTIAQRFAGADGDLLDALTDRPALEELRLYLRELRRDGERSMSEDEEELAAELNRDGFHGWGDLYKIASDSLTVEYADPDSGEIEELSVGQAKNRRSDPDRRVRRNAHRGLQEAWGERAPEFASMLNNILGTRLTLADRRGTDLLAEPLDDNRVERESLRAMLSAVDDFQPVVRDYLQVKAEALGVDELEYFDIWAPVGADEDASISWERAQEFVVEQVSSFSGEMAAFYRRAFASQWVEAEDREGKAQGAFCIPFPESEEVRVFLTFSGTMSGVMTLAHELGHAYHFWILRNQPPAARKVPMTLAESASTLSEKVVESAALEAADDDRRLRLLDERLGRAATFLADTPSRFRLERRMLEARREERLRPDQLTSMTQEVFGEAFGDAVRSYDDFFWASKLHFYLTRAPFYNFPYTFGYLFSKAIHDRVREGGDQLRERLEELLRDSGIRSAEDLADDVLGADLGDPDFWRGAMESIRGDLDQYESLVASRT